MWYEKGDDFVILHIKAQPNASKNKIVGLLGDALKVAIKAPAVEGAANKELVKFLSKTFKVPKSEIEFLSGKSSKLKRLRVPRSEALERLIKDMDEEG
ncbi:MAG: YggU family protein [Epsilonproteobacteria bacterium]|nr:YggU family protein [Campylobacterota bacterium]NPA64379.1 YggU family protein [Campylobacterota bacterium]